MDAKYVALDFQAFHWALLLPFFPPPHTMITTITCPTIILSFFITAFAKSIQDPEKI
jgi:hypothetical protein